jgi:endonuclease YncB( thermonuclease family)
MSCKELSHRNPEPNQRAGDDFYTARRTPVKMAGPAAPVERPSAAPIRPSPSRMPARRAALLMLAYAFAAFACMVPEAVYAQVKQRSAAACTLHGVGTGRVAEVRDGRSFILEDGREVRLPNIEVPLPVQAAAGGGQMPLASAARTALEQLVAGQMVELRQMRSASDRYGRMLADAYIVVNGMERSASREMLTLGFARVSIQGVHAPCATEFFAAEDMARRGKLGVWAEPYYALVSAGSLNDLLAHRGRFTVVEGQVLSVRESGGIIYVNFGRRWSEALTVTIAKRSERNLVATGLNPRNLENMRVRVRGWLEERNGPRIEVIRPEQIEIAER